MGCSMFERCVARGRKPYRKWLWANCGSSTLQRTRGASLICIQKEMEKRDVVSSVLLKSSPYHETLGNEGTRRGFLGPTRVNSIP